MYVANIHEAKSKLSELIQRVLAGEHVVIARSGVPVAKLVSFDDDLSPRVGGQLKGQIVIADDFDAYDAEMDRLFHGDDA